MPTNIEYLKSGADGLFWINRMIDSIFVVDMFLQFFVMYPMKNTQGTVMISSSKMIVRHYVKTWFVLDFISTLPYDLLGILMASDGMSKLKVLRALRLIRLVKLVRLLRGVRIFQRWESEISVQYRVMTLYVLMVTVVIIAHWISCILGIMNGFQGEFCYGDNIPDGCVVTWISQHAQEIVMQGQELTPLREYTVALYVTATMIVHPHVAPPRNEGERICFIALIFLAGFLWTRVISRTTAIYTSMNRHGIAYHQTMDDLNLITGEIGLPAPLRKRLRVYFMNIKNFSQRATWRDITSKMSSSLRTEVMYQTHRSWLRCVPYLRSASRYVVQDLTSKTEYIFVGMNELFGENFRLYVLQRGICASSSDGHLVVRAAGAVWGEEHLLLHNWELLAPNTSTSLGFVEVLMLTRAVFTEVCALHPGYKKKLRRHYMWYVILRGIVHEAKRKQREANLQNSQRSVISKTTLESSAVKTTEDDMPEPVTEPIDFPTGARISADLEDRLKETLKEYMNSSDQRTAERLDRIESLQRDMVNRFQRLEEGLMRLEGRSTKLDDRLKEKSFIDI
eukprot:gnl/MRDRNA2_/MRDRNA2_74510_c0_seq1.p1 gnl/MRDRNA2_/MRDRNA2_74510_c0~~gnl/MRDRNA2_/MRDRNA2_74510_c0_seq1.p1  ORF type:complete len:630 (-),score=62.67 gnl/MRDRNA2_/MRDRNA2_74510_c0_seq1:489-2183(-)